MKTGLIYKYSNHPIRYLISFVIFPLINNLLGFMTLYIYQYSLDTAVNRHTILTWRFLAALILYLLINAAISGLMRISQSEYNSVRVLEYRNDLSNHIIRSSLHEAGGIPSDIFIQIQQNIHKAVEYEGEVCGIILNSLTILGYGLYAIIFIDWRALFVVLGVMAGMLVFQGIISPLQNRYQEIYSKQSNNIQLMEDIISGIDIIKNYKMEEIIKDRYAKVTGDLAAAEKSAGDKLAAIHLIQHVGILVITAVTSFLAALLYLYGEASAGAAVSCTLLSVLFVQSFVKLIGCMQNITEEKAARKQLKMLTDLPEIPVRSVRQEVTLLPFILKDIEFKYGKDQLKPTLCVPWLELNRSGLYVIAGLSGSGKSTLVKLMAGLLPLGKGRISIGDYVLDADELHRLAAYSEQAPALFPVSVFDNIAYAQEHPDIEDIKQLCSSYKEVFLDDETLYYKMIETDDLNLSGGQKQIISLCRAFAKKADIILLDEPISAQDNDTQMISCKLIKQYSKEHLVIAVSHNLNLASEADEVLFMADGKIVQKGSHDKLYKECNQYHDMCDWEME